jgi:hypothetical protein
MGKSLRPSIPDTSVGDPRQKHTAAVPGMNRYRLTGDAPRFVVCQNYPYSPADRRLAATSTNALHTIDIHIIETFEARAKDLWGIHPARVPTE